ncbi:hypothetical protein AAEO56_06645 [Flavobacterium sp. DGU11]|uniref:DUF4825 domain-containing protein n=1 Tax=Flavobacterium arundinis TaxID=3139143 RepID=A0ABU9HUV5_9FLAO
MKNAFKIFLLIAVVAMAVTFVFIYFTGDEMGTEHKPETKVITEAVQVTPLEKELNNALNDPLIDDYYKETYTKGRLVIADDDKMLTITDSLFSRDTKKDFFYFMVFTKSMNGSDGFYSEALDYSSYRFVLNHTVAFSKYFAESPILNDKDMENWARYVMGEVFITHEVNEYDVINDEVKALKNKLVKI